jgi:nucleotide-binding universal stress UspA family protein
MDTPTWLVAYDFSRLAHLALKTAADMLSRMGGGRLVVMHVHQLHTGVDGNGIDLATVGAVDLERAYVADAERQLAEDVANVTAPGVVFERRLVSGRPAVVLCAAAIETRAALIVIGSHGRRGFERFLLGSVAEAVVRQARCPVLVVKEPPPA